MVPTQSCGVDEQRQCFWHSAWLTEDQDTARIVFIYLFILRQGLVNVALAHLELALYLDCSQIH